LGGQFEPKQGGQFRLENGGQFAPKWVIILDWNWVVNLTVFSKLINFNIRYILKEINYKTIIPYYKPYPIFSPYKLMKQILTFK